MDANSAAAQFGMTPHELQVAITLLCDRGLLTCTRGQPGDDDATYALAWLPLDEPESYPAEIRKRHERNMQKLGFAESGS